MPKQQAERVRGPITKDKDVPVKRRYPSDQGEYATERPEERADPTTSKRRAAPT